MEKESTYYVDEVMIISRPLKQNHIFNESKFKVIRTTDEDGNTIVILREKNGQNKIHRPDSVPNPDGK